MMHKRELLAEYVERWQYRELQRVYWLLVGAATSRARYPEIGTSEWGAKMWHKLGARAAHRAIRGSGRKLCEEATKAAVEKRRSDRESNEKERAEQKAKLEAAVGSSWRVANVFNNS
jgi:hypothetical protein